MEDLLARGFQAGAQAADQSLILAPEAERMVEGLREHDIDDVGTPRWMEQQGWVHKLNVQSHYNAHVHADEFVKDYLVSFDKVRVLVHELLLMEVWKAHMLPHLKKHLAKKVDSITSYLLISHEADLANLLEVTLYHEQALDNIEEDYLMELVDWCSRQLQYLNTRADADAAHVEHTTKEMLERSEVDELEEKLKASRLAVATCSVTIIRYLTDAASRLSVSLLTRLLLKHDIMMALVPLTESPPWKRRRADGSEERLEGSQWTKIEASDRFQLSNTDAQVWLALNNLIVDPNCRAKYVLDDTRKDTLFRLKRFMNDLLLDQLPVLRDLQRVFDELALNYQPNLEGYASSGLVIEQVPSIRVNMLDRSDWEAVAKRAKKGHLAPGAASKATQERMQGLLEAFNFMVDSSMMAGAEDRAAAAKAPTPAQQKPVKLSLYHRSRTGAMQAWSDLDLQIDCEQEPTPVSLQGDKGVVVHGKRWPLCKLNVSDSRVFPSKGRVVAHHHESTAEAILELPAAETKAKEDVQAVPAGLWVTIGLLAKDGFALQLRMKRAAQPCERDKADGTWHVFHAVGGAITLLECIDRPEAAAPSAASKIQPLYELD